MPPDAHALQFLGAMVLVLGWNVLVAGRIAMARGQRPGIVEVSGLCGLLIVPGALIAVASSWVTLGRTLAMLGPIWPLTLLLFVIQGVVAAWHRRVSSFVVVPLLALNVLLLVGAASRYAATLWPETPQALLAVGLALTSVTGLAWGPSALATPLALLLPLVVPVGPPRWPGAAALRALLAAGAAAVVSLTIVEYPAALRALSSFRSLGGLVLRERPRGDIALGVRIFPVLDRPPVPVAIRRDLPLAGTLGARVLAISITPAGATPATLDLLAGVLADIRSDSMTIAVALDYDRGEGERLRRDPVAAGERRVAILDQIVRRVRPDVLLPAVDPMRVGTQVFRGAPFSWWTDYFTAAARMAHTARPRTRVAVSISTWSLSDSALYQWIQDSPDIDIAGWSFAPDFRGGGAVRAQMRTAARWMSRTTKPHWVTAVRSYPLVFGESAQRDLLVGTLAWASAQPQVTAVVVDGAGDYDALTGLQDAGGRIRPATFSLAAAIRALREATIVLR
jgi:hypothetical protein